MECDASDEHLVDLAGPAVGLCLGEVSRVKRLNVTLNRDVRRSSTNRNGETLNDGNQQICNFLEKSLACVTTAHVSWQPNAQ